MQLGMNLEEWNGVERLFSDTNKVTANAAVNNSLLRDQHQLTINFEKAKTCNSKQNFS